MQRHLLWGLLPIALDCPLPPSTPPGQLGQCTIRSLTQCSGEEIRPLEVEIHTPKYSFKGSSSNAPKILTKYLIYTEKKPDMKGTEQIRHLSRTFEFCQKRKRIYIH